MTPTKEPIAPNKIPACSAVIILNHVRAATAISDKPPAIAVNVVFQLFMLFSFVVRQAAGNPLEDSRSIGLLCSIVME